MSKDRKTATLALSGKSKNDLRSLALKYLSIEYDEIRSFDRNQLISELSNAASKNSDLQDEIAEDAISVKPSFFLMHTVKREQFKLQHAELTEQLNEAFKLISMQLSRQKGRSVYKDFEVERVDVHGGRILEIHLTWQQIHWYWKAKPVQLAHVYELKFGLAILDVLSEKTLIACHHVKERDHIVKAISNVLPVRMTQLVLTNALLNQIGSFDNLKRAGYFMTDSMPSVPETVIYADEKLSNKKIVRDEEENPRSQRKISFYRVPLLGVEEHGIGVTSNTGKLWIPRHIPVESLREYGMELIGRISQSIADLENSNMHLVIFRSLGAGFVREISDISPISLRSEVIRLVETLMLMFINEERERSFSVSAEILTRSVPDLFNYPRLILADEETESFAFLRDNDGTSELLKISVDRDGDYSIEHLLTGEDVILESLRHPVSGEPIDATDALSHLQLIPTFKLVRAIVAAFEHLSSTIPALSEVEDVLFRIEENKVILDLPASLGQTGITSSSAQIFPEEIPELRSAMKQSISSRKSINEVLVKMGEKCDFMKDENCRMCVEDQNFICLRSLVASFFQGIVLLAHKSIELSDIQFDITYGKQKLRAYAFAKIGTKLKGLSLRNASGAILLSQIIAHIDKSTFDVIVVVTPRTVNEDLLDRFRLLAGVFQKRLLVLDDNVLQKMMSYFQEQLDFDGRNFENMLSQSSN